MSEFNAGLPQRSSGKRTRVGGIEYYPAGTPLLFNDEEGTWLRAGTFTNYSSQYTALLKVHPGWAVKDLPTANAIATNYGYNGKIFYTGGNYISVGGGTSGNWLYHKSGSTLALSGTTQLSSLSALMTGMFCAVQLGTSILVGGSTGGVTAFGISTNNAAFVAASSGLPGGFSVPCMTTNGTNLVVLMLASTGSNSSSFYTSTNGTAWTNRTGTGGTAGTINAMYWSACANAFLYNINNNAINKSVDGYTQTTCSLPAGVSFRADTWDLYCASSSTSTIIVLADGRLLRTIDGNTFAIVDPSATGCFLTNSTSKIVYDGSRYIIYIASGGTATPTFIYSEDDGLTWRQSLVFEDASIVLNSTPPWLAIMLNSANGKVIMGAGVNGPNVITTLYDMTGLVASGVLPSRVGSFRPIVTSNAVATSLPLYGYVRVA